MNGSKLFQTVAIFVSALFLFAGNQERTTQQKVSVRLRLLPFTVSDAQGKPARGLTKEDFELLVDGRPVAINSLDERDYSQLRQAMAKGEQPAVGDLPPRRILLLFDTLSSSLQNEDGAIYRTENLKKLGADVGETETTFAARDASSRGIDDSDADANMQRGVRQAKIAAAKAAIAGLLPTDEVAVIEIGSSPRILQSFTTDHDKVRAAVEQISLPMNLTAMSPQHSTHWVENVEPGQTPVSDSLELAEKQAKLQIRRMMISLFTARQLKMYQAISQILAGLPGAKQVILFSSGFPAFESMTDRNPEDADGHFVINKAQELSMITSVLASSGTRINSISIAGTDRPRPGTPEESSIALMAQETGGQFFNARTQIEGALDQALIGLDTYYELFFTPPGTADGSFHSVELRAKGTGMKVRTPKGYLDERAYDQTAAVTRQANIDRSFWQPLLVNDLGVEFSSALIPLGPGKAALHVRALFDADAPLAPQYDAYVSLGRGGEAVDQGVWHLDAAKDPLHQLDLLLPLPAGETSYQFALQASASGTMALDVGGFSVPETITAPVIGPVYLSQPNGTPAAPMTVTETLKQAAFAIPAALENLVAETAVREAAQGARVRAGFVFAGPEITSLIFQVKSGDQSMAMNGEDFASEPLADGLVILHGTLVVPPLPAGDAEVIIIGVAGEKKYRLASKTLMILE